MSVLAVLAHHDPDGQVGNHVRFAARALRPAADRLVVVTTSRLTSAAKSALAASDEIIERDNTGYDFYSWRAGLLATPDWADYERVILANDSIIGPLVPPAQLLDHMAAARADAYGITMSKQQVRHVQSYFTVFGLRALTNPRLRAFWTGMTPVDDRTQVIRRYELGLGRVVADAGLAVSSYFTATPHEERLMAARMASYHRSGAARPLAAGAAYALQPVRRVAESPILGLWDRVFDAARLPAVKVSLFSRDPYRIDRSAVLDRLTASYPEVFDGFRDYLRRIGVTW